MSKTEGKTELRSLTYEDIIKKIQEMGERKFRAQQIFKWLHKKNVQDIDEMTDLPKDLREKLADIFFIAKVEKEECLISKKDETRKYLFKLYDGNIIESVLMKYEHGNSVCISSQAGCRMGCKFCASTLLGLSRNLHAGEMLGQIYAIESDTGERISNVVVMGTGEPLDNYEQLLGFIKNISHKEGHDISRRNITVSTCGIVEKIKNLADEELPITLAISLHAPCDSIRQELMPVANKYSIKELMSVCDDYFLRTKRRITFEYSLIKGINDGEEHAQMLANLLKGKNCHVNLIPVNPVKERNYKRTDTKVAERFKIILEKNRINVTIRRRMGSDIDAACGQLRMKFENKFSNLSDARRNASHSAKYADKNLERKGEG